MNLIYYPVEAHIRTIPPRSSVSYGDIAQRTRRMEFRSNAILSYPCMELDAPPAIARREIMAEGRIETAGDQNRHKNGPAAIVPKLLRGCFSVFLFLCEGVCVMPQGAIKKLITDKGFGFIEGENGDIFFHHSALDGVDIEDLSEGQTVDYTEGRGPKGPRAENVRVV